MRSIRFSSSRTLPGQEYATSDFIASADTQGRPSIGWRARKAAAQLSGQTSTLGDSAAELTEKLAGVASDVSARVGEATQDVGGRVGELAQEVGSRAADVGGRVGVVAQDVGDRVVAGALNKTGSFIMRADKVGADTLLAQIVQMVAQAQRSRAPIQRLADTVSGWFVPTVIAIALLAVVLAIVNRLREVGGGFNPPSGDYDWPDDVEGYGMSFGLPATFELYTNADWDKLSNKLGSRLRGTLAKGARRG